jgi:hypothetical protein
METILVVRYAKATPLRESARKRADISVLGCAWRVAAGYVRLAASM